MYSNPISRKPDNLLMPLPSFSVASFVDRKKPAETTDDLAAVKAAAWAWYHHGSGSEGKPMREFGITRTCTLPKPSRYKLEAIRISRSIIEDKPQTPNTHNSLLDEYEIDSISRRLTDLLDPTDHNSFSLRSFDSEMDRQHSLSLGSGVNLERKKTKHKKLRGLWRRSSVICGKTEDVVSSSLVRLPEKQARQMRRLSSAANEQPMA